MKSVFLILCLLSMAHTAFAKLCSKTPYGQPCTPDPGDETDAAKRQIIKLMKLAKRAEPDVIALESQYRLVRDDQNASDAAKLAALEPFRKAKLAQDALYNDAITKTLELYHVQPDGGEPVPVATPQVPGIEWAKGMSAHWDPGSPTPVLTSSWRLYLRHEIRACIIRAGFI